MQKVSRFRGMAGEVTYQFLSPVTWLSALPILVVFALLWLIANMAGGQARFIALAAFVMAYAMIAGRFALPAAEGEFDSGFFSASGNGSKLWFFTGRYIALIVAWMLALAPLAWAAIGAGDPLTLIQSAGLPLAALGLASLLVLTLSLIVATRAKTLREAFSRDAWGWLLSEHRADLPPFYAALVGSLVVFSAVYLLPPALLVFFTFKISLQSGMALANLLGLLLLSVSPILLGRMCGAFVAGEDELELAAQNLLSLLGIVPPADSRQQELDLAIEQPAPAEKKLSFDEMVAKTRALSSDALIAEIRKAETNLAAHPHDPYTVVELAMLYRKAGEAEKALEAAANAITQAVQDGYTEIGVSLFRGFAKERADLGLDAHTLEILGNVLLKQELVLDAGWCLHESAINAGDILKAQKKLLHVASVAEEAQKHAEAVALYDFFIAAYPDTNLAQYARQGKNRAEAAQG